MNENHRSGTGQEFRLDKSRLTAQINHTGTLILSMTDMTVCSCGQLEMMISVTMDGSIVGHAPPATTTYVKRNIKFHCENFI